MNNKSRYIAFAAIGALTFSGCDLDEYNPSAGSTTLTNYTTWAGLQTHCYSTLYHELYSKSDFLFLSEGGTDLWLNPSGTEYASQVFYYDGLSVARQEPDKVWKQAYTIIATCNSVIQNADQVEGGKAEDIAVLKAEAQCIRAFMHLTLVTYFGPVTICNTVVGEASDTPTRDSQEKVYQSIIADLKEAAEHLEVQPFGGNYARVSKKTALGLLARAYAQGAGEGLKENGISYWQRAKEVSEDLIANASTYGFQLYNDVDDVWAQANNRGSVNKEYLFVVSGLDGTDANANNITYPNATNLLYAYTRPNPGTLQDIYKTSSTSSNYLLGTHNQSGVMAPTRHAIEVFGDWDKRYENTFLTAFGEFTVDGLSSQTYARKSITVTAAIAKKYGFGEEVLVATVSQDDWDNDEDYYNSLYPSTQYNIQFEQNGPVGEYKIYNNPAIGKIITPYVNLKRTSATLGTQTEATGIWSKDGVLGTVAPKNALVVPMPLETDDHRFAIYLSKKTLSAEEKLAYAPTAVINIADLFGVGSDYETDYRTENYKFATASTAAQKLFPMFIKYNSLYYGAMRESGYEFRNGDIAIMRAAELYLIAAEAEVMTGNASAAIPYIEALHNRAVRPGFTAPAVAAPTEQDILDEYAREMTGEHMRWPVLKRHRGINGGNNLMKSALEAYNKKAAASFREDIHYFRPIPQKFLDQIKNKDEYGDNGYGYVASKGF